MILNKCVAMKKNKHKQIVILLGAGASKPWDGLLASDFQKIFEEDITYKVNNGKTVGKYIFDEILSKIEDPNFETFFAVLEEIMEYIYSDNEEKKYIINTPISHIISEMQQEIKNQIFNGTQNIEELSYNLYRHFIDIVTEKVNEYNETVDEKRILKTYLRYFTETFLNNGYSIKFYTTNYDTIIPYVISPKFNIYEGLTNFGAVKRFNVNLEAFRKARISHFNLHGSIFLSRPWNIEDVYGKEILHCTKRPVMPPYPMAHNYGKSSGLLPFSPIIIGYNKTQRMINQPFNLGFAAFMNDLSRCNIILTVGYSFSDPHINSMLDSFVRWDKVKFIHIDKYEKQNFDIYRNYKDDQVNSLIMNAGNFFDNKTQNDEWVYDLLSKARIYKKGYYNFLQKISNWNFLLY
jgi:NAD-dependent SIR2 family protein deacetylase